MIEIKVQCECGQRYKFDVEPVNGQMPFPVKCPLCGANGTDKANTLIHERLAAETAAPPPSPEAVARTTESTAGTRLTIKQAPLRVTAAPVAAATPVETGNRPLASTPQPEAAGEREGNFALSLGGVILGAVLGMIAWHLICRFTGWRVGFMALITGCMAGVAPQLLGHYRSKLMGVLAAVVTLLAIFGAQYLNAQVQFERFIDEAESEGYEAEMDYAKRAAQAIPSGSEKEIRDFLAKEQSTDGDTVKAADVDAEEVAELRAQLPKFQDLASGKISQADYGKELREGSDEMQETGGFKIYLLIRALGIFNLANIVLGVGAAYATAKG